MADIQKLNVNNTTYDISTTWEKVTGKPSSFTPSSHTHDGRYIKWGGSAADTNAMGWGTLTTANGYTILSHVSSSDGGDWGMVNKSGQIFMQLDGYYYQNEGRYRVLDTSDSNSFAPSSHTHSYLPLSGGTVTGPIEIKSASSGNYNEGLRISPASNNWAGITFGSTGLAGAPVNGWFAALNPSDQFIISPGDSSNTTGLTLNSGGDAKWRNNIILHSGNISSYALTTLPSHTHTFASLTSKPATISGYGITDTLNFAIGTKYLGARFPNQDFANKAANTYIEWWQSGAGFFNFMAGKYIVAGGTSSHFLKGDGSLDSTAYLPLSGGTMTGHIKFNDNSLPSKTLSYVCGIDAFANGGEMGWMSGSDFVAQYAPTRTGTGASGTWGINISGNAAAATNATYAANDVDGSPFKTTYLRKVTVANNTENDFNSFSNMTLTGRGDPTTGASLKNAPWSGGGPAGGYGVLTYLWSIYGTQMAWGYGSNRIYIRNKYYTGNTSTWSSSWDSIALTSDIPTSLPANGGTSTYASRLGDSNSYYTKSSLDTALAGKAASSHTHSYLPLSGGTMTGLLTTTSGNSHNGIKIGSNYINAINGDLIFQNNGAIRFGGDSWDYNVWAGLKYVHSSKSIYLGLADGTQFTANTGQTGGKVYFPGISGLYAAAYYQTSDERLKTFYDPIKVDLDKLSKLRKNYFKFKDKDKLEIGVSAQEIQQLYPEIVSIDDNGYLSVAYDKLSVITLAAIDELDDNIKELRRENNDLKDQLEAIKNILKEKGIL